MVLKSQRSVNLFAQQIRIERNLEEMKRDIKRENDLEAEKSERGRRYRNGSAIMASVKVSFNFQNSLNPNEDCCQWSLTWTNIQTHIERDKQTQSTKQPQHMEINKNLKYEVPKEVDLMESRLGTAIGDYSKTKVAREGTKRKKKTQTWIEPLPHKGEEEESKRP